MAIEKFLNIEIEEPPVELQLSVEMRVREVMKSDDVDNIKRYCTHLIRHQMKQDVFLSGVLERIVELEVILARRELKEEKKLLTGSKTSSIFRKKLPCQKEKEPTGQKREDLPKSRG